MTQWAVKVTAHRSYRTLRQFLAGAPADRSPGDGTKKAPACKQNS